MPPKKKLKTGENSSVAIQEHENSQMGNRDITTIPKDEYVCVLRPFFDFKAENALAAEPQELEDVFAEYQKQAEAEIEAKIIDQAARDYPDRKWVMLWEGFQFFEEYRRRVNYCSPDRFGMYIYNDFEGYGYQELMENMINAFDTAVKKNDNVTQTWAIVSGMGWWLNEVDMYPFAHNDDSAKNRALIRLLGYALLRGLAAIDGIDELKPDGKYPDVPQVITMFLCWAEDFLEMGITGEALEWRAHAAAYFEKGQYDADRGIGGSKKLLEAIKDADIEKIPPKARRDPWNWKQEELLAYKADFANDARGKIGGKKYDITMMTREQRAKFAFDHEDPLKDVSLKDLKEGKVDFA